MSRIRALSFDLDDTLWSLDQVIERAEARMLAYFERKHPAVIACYTPEAVAENRQLVLEESPEIAHDLRELRLRILRRITGLSGVEPIAAEEALDVFMEARNEVRLFDETRPVLDALHTRYTLVALTNGNADVHRIGIGHYFRATILASQVGAAKPSSRMFDAALGHAAVAPEQMLHVGDDPETDVFGAASHGIGAIWLNRGGHAWPSHLPPVPYREIRTLDQLHTLIDEDATRREDFLP